MSVGDVDAGARAVAERLAALVPAGLRVATCLPPGPAAVETIFGLARLGAVEVPLAPDLPPAAVRALARAAEVGLAVVSTAVLAHNPQLAGVLGEAGPVLLVGEPDTAHDGGLARLG